MLSKNINSKSMNFSSNSNIQMRPFRAYRNSLDLKANFFISSRTTDYASQTSSEGAVLNHPAASSNERFHAVVIEPTEIDYLKQIVLAYMTGTDPMVCSRKGVQSSKRFFLDDGESNLCTSSLYGWRKNLNYRARKTPTNGNFRRSSVAFDVVFLFHLALVE